MSIQEIEKICKNCNLCPDKITVNETKTIYPRKWIFFGERQYQSVPNGKVTLVFRDCSAKDGRDAVGKDTDKCLVPDEFVPLVANQ